jgi:Fur family ferric uptake transcriptional regulator
MTAKASILKSHGLRKTKARLAVLDYFQSHSSALAPGDLNQALGADLDRVTLYRIIQSFEEHGIIHKVPDDEVAVKYSLCGTGCTPTEHHDHHLHFKCKGCGETRCLPKQAIPSFEVPAGYHVEETEILINGICAKCNSA